MDNSLITRPLLAGLSVGAFCLTTCFPFVASFLVAEERTPRGNFTVILQFILGRLSGYISFGLLVGYLGEKIQERWADLIVHTSLVFLSVILILYMIGLWKQSKDFWCSAESFRSRSPIAMGFLMGINICPPFLLSLAYVFSLHSTLQGVIYFLLFFLSSSLYLLPLIFVGMLSRIKEMRAVARMSGLLVGIIFLVYAVYSLAAFMK